MLSYGKRVYGKNDVESLVKPDYARVLATAFLFIVTGLFFMATTAMAITTPASGSFAYDVYNIAITQMLGGPIGFVAGTAGVVYGAAMAIKGAFMPAAMGIIGGAMLVEAPTIANSMGAMIPMVH